MQIKYWYSNLLAWQPFAVCHRMYQTPCLDGHRPILENGARPMRANARL